MLSASARASRLTAPVALTAAAACLLGLAVTWVLAELVPVGHTHDAAALNGFLQLSRPRVDVITNQVIQLVGPVPYAAAGAALVAVALVRRRPRVAVAVIVALAGGVGSAELLKPLLAHPHAAAGSHQIPPASWPSGHATAAMTLALCAVLVAPARLRPAAAALGAAFPVAVGFSLLTAAWHLPSDVIGGFLLAGLWLSLVIAALRLADVRWPRRAARVRERRTRPAPAIEIAAPAALLAVAAGVVLAALVLGPHGAATFADTNGSLIVAGATIAAVATALSSGLWAALRR